MNIETLRILDALAREKGIDREMLIQGLEQAMCSAARKHFNSLDLEEFGCEVDRLGGAITIWRQLPDGTREDVPLAQLGRIPAQTFKQVLIQRVREEERTSLLDEFSRRQGELVTGLAQRYEGNALIVQIDRAEGFMPRTLPASPDADGPGRLRPRKRLDVVEPVRRRRHPQGQRRGRPR